MEVGTAIGRHCNKKWQKGGLAAPECASYKILSSGQVKMYPGQRRIGFLFTAGQM